MLTLLCTLVLTLELTLALPKVLALVVIFVLMLVLTLVQIRVLLSLGVSSWGGGGAQSAFPLARTISDTDDRGRHDELSIPREIWTADYSTDTEQYEVHQVYQQTHPVVYPYHQVHHHQDQVYQQTHPVVYPYHQVHHHQVQIHHRCHRLRSQKVVYLAHAVLPYFGYASLFETFLPAVSQSPLRCTVLFPPSPLYVLRT